MRLNIKKGIDVAMAKAQLNGHQFAEKLGISPQLFAHRKRSENITLKQAAEIANVAGITIFELIDDMTEHPAIVENEVKKKPTTVSMI